jgi:hypothetical protein
MTERLRGNLLARPLTLPAGLKCAGRVQAMWRWREEIAARPAAQVDGLDTVCRASMLTR